MKQPTYIKTFETKAKAESMMRTKNRANRVPGWLWVMVDGPEDDFVLVDIRTAIDMNMGYSWAA